MVLERRETRAREKKTYLEKWIPISHRQHVWVSEFGCEISVQLELFQ